MAADLGSQPHTGLMVPLCGDAHVLNFGLWATPERHLLFDLREFDETLPGPFEWDVKRLAASLVVPPPVRAGWRQRTGRRRRHAGQWTPTRPRCTGAAPRCPNSTSGTRVCTWTTCATFFQSADRGRLSTHIERQQRRRTSRGAFANSPRWPTGDPESPKTRRCGVTVDDDQQSDLVDHLLAESG